MNRTMFYGDVQVKGLLPTWANVYAIIVGTSNDATCAGACNTHARLTIVYVGGRANG